MMKIIGCEKVEMKGEGMMIVLLILSKIAGTLLVLVMIIIMFLML